MLPWSYPGKHWPGDISFLPWCLFAPRSTVFICCWFAQRAGTDEEGWFWFHKCAVSPGESSVAKGYRERAVIRVKRCQVTTTKSCNVGKFENWVKGRNQDFTAFQNNFLLPLSLVWCSHNENLAEHHGWPEKLLSIPGCVSLSFSSSFF